LHVVSPFAIFTLLYEPHNRVARRVKTAKGTAQGISLSGIVFPQPPGHNEQPKFRHKKTANAQVAVLPTFWSFHAPWKRA